MHDDHSLMEGRLVRSLQRIGDSVYSDRVAIELAGWDVPGEPVPVAEGLTAQYTPIRIGDRWGPPWSTTWFRLRGTVPPAWAGRTVEAVLDIGFDVLRTGFHAEGMVYDPGGEPVKGLNPRNQWVRVGAPVRGGEAVELYVEAAANPSEHLLREAELWCATTAVRTGAEYPYPALDRIWKLVLLQQFHDILPGSSIHWVHREAEANYAAVAAELHDLIASAQRALAGSGPRQLMSTPRRTLVTGLWRSVRARLPCRRVSNHRATAPTGCSRTNYCGCASTHGA